ncbi:MAG: hypothetical protein M3Y72_26130 [Acidobacteriota bacterium]|nr:hypothetical protein [Acidobacteriota bacterium]
MLAQRKLIVSLALFLLAIPASADSVVYVVNTSQQFGTINLDTGAFAQIGPNTPEGEQGLVPGPNGSLLTLTYSGNLDAINPATGATIVIGPTGLASCAAPTSPCGPTAANAFAELGGTLYATDFQNHLYRVNPLNGAATLIGPTGVPALPITPGTTNPDGSVNFFDEALFNANGKLYATFDTGKGSPSGVTPVIPAHLYQIDPSTGLTTLIGPTTFSLNTAIELNGTVYAFENMTSQVVTLNLANGNTTFFSNFDTSAGEIGGASPVPEPVSTALAAVGLTAILI